MTVDPFGRAIRDHHLGERTDPLIDRDGAEWREHRIDEWYFGTHDPDAWRDQWLEGPLIDLGAGAGRDALYYQEQFETVAIEVSDHLVELLRDRGVTNVERADMFSLRRHFDRDRFRSAHAVGTQLGLAGSMAGVRTFLDDLGSITTPDATAILDNYAPERAVQTDLFAYRDDPAPGLGYRVYHEEYDGTIGRTLLFRVFSVDRLRDATVGSPWRVGAVRHTDNQWRAVLHKD